MIKWNYIWRHLRELTQKLMGKEIGRGRFLITSLTTENNVYYQPRYILKLLTNLGFQPNYFGYFEKGEIYNLRRLKVIGSGLWQEHIRIFPDEIRGHFEVSYEEDTQLHISGETIKPLSPGLIGAIKRMVE